ncbi:MAG TPA: mechanosensitive ion channel family protein [Actinomycetota bacterium]|nr:mechanosensitive ion channel family protein [Actinomycetota bacterium]
MSQAGVVSALRLAGILLGAVLCARVMRRAVTRLQAKVSDQESPLRSLQRTQTLAKVASSAGIVVIWSIAFVYVVGELGFNLAPLLAGAGVIGLAVGFGAQNLVRDVVTGFFILLEDQYGVGDVIEVNQTAAGTVEQFTLRLTGMRGVDGTLHFIANGEITLVSNRSKDWSRAVVDVGVAYKEDPDKVRDVLERVAREAADDGGVSVSLNGQPEVLGIEMLGEYEVVWRMLAETKPGKQWLVARDLKERVKVAFDHAEIEIPFPHRVMVSAGDGSSSTSAA